MAKMTREKWKQIGSICGYDGTRTASVWSKDADRLRKACPYETWKKMAGMFDFLRPNKGGEDELAKAQEKIRQAIVDIPKELWTIDADDLDDPNEQGIYPIACSIELPNGFRMETTGHGKDGKIYDLDHEFLKTAGADGAEF